MPDIPVLPTKDSPPFKQENWLYTLFKFAFFATFYFHILFEPTSSNYGGG